jgi:hypothetical protein
MDITNGRTARIPVFEKLMASFKMGRNLRHEKKDSKLNLIYRDELSERALTF